MSSTNSVMPKISKAMAPLSPYALTSDASCLAGDPLNSQSAGQVTQWPNRHLGLWIATCPT